MPRPQIFAQIGQRLFKPQLDEVLDYLDQNILVGGDGNSGLGIVDEANNDGAFLDTATNNGSSALKFEVPPGEVVYIQVPANANGVNPYMVKSVPFTVHRTPTAAAAKNVHMGFVWFSFGAPRSEFTDSTGYQVGWWMQWWGSGVIIGGVTQAVAATLSAVTTAIKGITPTADRLYLASAYADDADGFLMGFYNTFASETLVIYLPTEVLYLEDA